MGPRLWYSTLALRVVYSDASDTGYGGYTVEHEHHMHIEPKWIPQALNQQADWLSHN